MTKVPGAAKAEERITKTRNLRPLHSSYFRPLGFDSFAKSPSAALRFILRRCGVLLWTPRSSTCLRQAVARLVSEIFTLPSGLTTSYQVTRFARSRLVYGHNNKNLLFIAGGCQGGSNLVELGGLCSRGCAGATSAGTRGRVRPVLPDDALPQPPYGHLGYFLDLFALTLLIGRASLGQGRISPAA